MRIKKEINIQIGEQIKTARERAKLTQEQFSELVNVSPQFISDLERGVVGISITTLKRACTVLGISSDQILFGTESNDRSILLADKCKNLTDEQYRLLVEIATKFIEAVNL